MATKKFPKAKRKTTARNVSKVSAAAQPRFVNFVAESGKADPEGPWVFDRATSLIWARSVLVGEYTWADAKKACEAVKFRGQACRAPTAHERFSISDLTKRDPAIDTAHFAKQSGWEWTSTPVQPDSNGFPRDYAWCVDLGFGNCFWLVQSGHFRVRPVLAGQSFSFDF